MSFVPVVWSGGIQEWMRQVANVLNPAANGYPFPSHDTAPSDVAAGYTYYDTALNKVRTFDGSVFQNHF